MSTAGISANKLELIQIAKAVASEKSIDESIVLEAIEEAIQKAARLRYGAELDIRAKINPTTGEQSLRRVISVVADEEVENETTQVGISAAKLDNKLMEIGDEISTTLPPLEFGRVQAQMAKQVIMGKVRDAERARQYLEFKDRIGEIINGIVKRVEYGHIIVDLGRAEGVIRRDQALPRENVKGGDRIRAYIMDVREEPRGSQIFLSRRGQNVRLASQLSGWALDILTEEQESERRQQEFKERSELFMAGLDVDEMVAQLLVSEGFETMEEVGYVAMEDLTSIEGFDDETAAELQTRAREYLDRIAAEQDAKRVELGVEDGVLEIEGVTLPMAVRFGENEVKTVEDVAGLVPDDLNGYSEYKNGERIHEEGMIEDFKLSDEDATRLIMQARVAAGWIEASALEPEVEEGEEGAEGEAAEETAAEPTAETLFN